MTGDTVAFDSIGFDGPSVINVPVQAIHPGSTLPGLGFAPVGMPVNVRFPFTDPGTPDHQTANIAWGEGVARHVYQSPGGFQILIILADDDGDAEQDGDRITAVTVEQALDEAIALLDELIANTTAFGQRKSLDKVAKALYGNPRGSNGAQRGRSRDEADPPRAVSAGRIGPRHLFDHKPLLLYYDRWQ